MNQRSKTPKRTLELRSSACPQKSMPDCSNHRWRRRLVDYTKCRRDGTTPSNVNATSPPSAVYPKKDARLGLPTCHALDTSLASMILASRPIQMLQDKNKKKDDDRIDFFLKIVPKSQRKASRISTLDRADHRKVVLLRTIRSLSSSSRSVDSDTTIPPFQRHTTLVKHSVSTPCA
jgi:hypothetical protein